MEYARPFRRRLWVFLLAAGIATICVVASGGVLRHQEALGEARASIHELSFRALAGFLRAVQLAEEGARQPGPKLDDEGVERLAELLDEATEAAVSFAATVEDLGLSDEAEALRGEIRELLATGEQVLGTGVAREEGRGELLRLSARIETAADRLDEIDHVTTGVLREQLRRSVFWLQAGLAGTLVGVLLALAGVVLVLLEVLNDLLPPDDLAGEVEALALQEDVQARLELLARHHGLREASGGWKLGLLRVVSERRTHVVFEVEATSGGQRMLLWGRRYRWSALLKGFQRLLLPAFGRSAWRVLCRMHHAGMDGPVPVASAQVRRSRVPVGRILLMEHLGTLVSLRRYVRSGFLLLGPQERRLLLQRVGAFVRDLHGLGIVGISGRGLHAQHLETPQPRLVLCDLDKVHPLGSRAGMVLGPLLRVRDRRRIRRIFEETLSPEESALLRKVLVSRA